MKTTSIPRSARSEVQARQTTSSEQNTLKSAETDQNRLLNYIIFSFIAAVAITVTVWAVVSPSNSY